MFGKPQWFKARQRGWGVTPITWQGWAYTSIWSAVVAVPFLALLSQGLGIEALVWLAAAPAALVWDVRSLLAEMRRQSDDDVLYIGDEEAPPTRLATQRYDFRLRR